MEDNLLIIENLSVSYGTDNILESISLHIDSGEFIGLHGGNGSGKTTLLKAISGEIESQSETMLLCGNKIQPNNIVTNIALGIIYVHQFPICFPDLYVWENFAIWYSVINKSNLLKKKETIAYLTKNLNEFELKIPLEKKVYELTQSELQILEFTRCFLVTPKLILIDETTSILNSEISTKILKALKEYCKIGASVILVSHRFEELEKYSDRIYEINKKAIFPYDSSHHKTYNNEFNISDHIKPSSRYVLDIQLELKETKNKFHLQLAEKEIIGITGSGGVDYEFLPETILNVLAKQFKIGKNFSYLGKNRDEDWIFDGQTVEFNLLITKNKNIFVKNENVDETIKYFNINPADKNKLSDELSGGNKLKLAIARTILTDAPIIILDEPFTGIDRDSRIEIIKIIRNTIKNNNASFIIFSKENSLLTSFANQVIAFNDNGSYSTYDSTEFDKRNWN